ncbi:MAG: DNA recombination protein RmuC [Bacteroidales bacterium]|nr:DNA recombination protein RmuC [Bacteroidales bacterium]MBN2748167.1 DNA recombination protein RmuC [Bacteroidales bacterium]
MVIVLVFLVVGIVIGAIAVWLIFKGKQDDKASLSGKLLEQDRVILDLSSQLAATQARLELANKQTVATAAERDKIYADYQQSIESVKQANEQLSIARSRLEQADKQLAISIEEGKRLQQELSVAREKWVEFDKENKYLKEAIGKQKTDLEDIGNSFKNEFKVLADQILEDKSKRFTEQNQLNLERLLKPLGENISVFQKKVEEVYDKESKERFSLGREVEKLVVLNQRISEEANNLTNALKGQVKQQGNWGEMILESILEKSGLVKGREYFVQESYKDDEGRRFQPDVIVAYPDNRKIVVDSKVSLIAYERYTTAAEPTEQQKALVEHIRSIRSHVEMLSAKNYQDLVGSLDFVMMFVPIEPAFLAAMQADAELWNYAYSRRVLLISPTNLIAALKMIYDLWQRENQNRNAMEIADRGGQLYDKFVGFVENLKAVGENIARTNKSYELAMGQLTEGRGNLVNQVQKLKELGAKAKKAISEDILSESGFESSNGLLANNTIGEE